MTKKNTKNELSFEENFEKLSSLVSELETTNMTLEESLSSYEKGIDLINICKKQLDNAEQRLEILNKNTMTVEYALMEDLSRGIENEYDSEDGE